MCRALITTYVFVKYFEFRFFLMLDLFGFCSQKNGAEVNLGMGQMSEYEVTLLEKAVPELNKNIKKGEEWIKANPAQ